MPSPDPVDARLLLPELHENLMVLLHDLTPEQWPAPTACAGWSVKDVALHLLRGDIGFALPRARR